MKEATQARATPLGNYYATLAAPRPYVLDVDRIARGLATEWATKREKSRRRLARFLIHRRRP